MFITFSFISLLRYMHLIDKFIIIIILIRGNTVHRFSNSCLSNRLLLIILLKVILIIMNNVNDIMKVNSIKYE